jgi:hypothetical protein
MGWNEYLLDIEHGAATWPYHELFYILAWRDVGVC